MKDKVYTFIGTSVTNTELTAWIMIVANSRKVKVTDIRYFGSRRFGSPRPDSDIDVYITTPKGKKHFSKGNNTLFTEMFKGYQIEFHAYEDWGDGFVPTHLIGSNTENEILIFNQVVQK